MELYDLSMLMGDNTKADMFLAKRSLNLQPAGSEKQWHILLINTKSGEIPALCLYNDHTTGSSVVLRSGTIFKNNPYENIPVEMKDGSAPPAPSVNLFRASYVPSSGIAGDAGEISDASKEKVKGFISVLLHTEKTVPDTELEQKLAEMQEKQNDLKEQLKRTEAEKEAVEKEKASYEKARKRQEKEAEDLRAVVEKVKAARDKLKNDNADLLEENRKLKKEAAEHRPDEIPNPDEIYTKVNAALGGNTKAEDLALQKMGKAAKQTSGEIAASGIIKQIKELKDQLREKEMEIEELKKAAASAENTTAEPVQDETLVKENISLKAKLEVYSEIVEKYIAQTGKTAYHEDFNGRAVH